MRQLLCRKYSLNTQGSHKASVIFLCSLSFFSQSFADNTTCLTEYSHAQDTLTSFLASSILIPGEPSLIYQTHFDRSSWQGDLVAVSLNDSGETMAGKSELWRASEVRSTERKVFSINPDINHTYQGIELSWEKLNKRQKKHLKAKNTDNLAKKRLAWLIGNKGGEVPQLRKKSHILGDISSSNISLLSRQTDFGYSEIEDKQGKHYVNFLNQQSHQQQAVFVGSNGGALHAFDTLNGNELFAYVPNTVLPKIAIISQPNYGCQSMGCLPHEPLVDGKSTVADAYFGDNWHSILIGTLGLGGKGLYALDVTDVEHFSERNVLWEVSTQNTHIDSITYKQYLGFINQQASIVRLKSGRWVVIVGNGSASVKQQAVLFIIDLETGHLIKTLNTQTGSAKRPNGLSAPIGIDTNDDKSVDRIYAGDLLGNVWRFDLDNLDPEKWSVAFGRRPLFRACEDRACKKPQAIKAKLQVGDHPKRGVMIYFGTHQNSSEQVSTVNSFYAIRDNDHRVLSTKHLVEQKILQQHSVGSSLEMRVTSNFDVNYKNKQGWMLKLGKDFSQLTGERVSTQVLLREGELVIGTEIPVGTSCKAYQSRWIMKLNALQGKRLQRITFDTNHDNKLTIEDNVDYARQSTIVSGIRLTGSVAASPVIFGSSKHTESLLSIMGDGTLKLLKTSTTSSSGRVSWRQLR